MHPVTSFRPRWTDNAHPSNGFQRVSVLPGPERGVAPASAAVESPVGGATAGPAPIFADLLADLLSIDSVPLDGHFFDDLGADSMVMARFCARVRKQPDLPSVSMKDIYSHPTVGSLAAALGGDQATRIEPTPPATETVRRATTAQYVLCGALQLLAVIGYLSVASPAIAGGVGWISAGSGVIEVYLRSAALGAATFLAASVVPIVAKWALIGRWKRQQIDVWSLAYVRFWIVKTLIRTGPLAFFAGSPLYVFYLRALGAKIGHGVVIFSRHLPVCTDLLTIGDDTVIRKDTFFNCYRANAGTIQTGSVTIGNNVVVGEAAVIDIETSLGDRSQLGHVSSLQAGQSLPAGERRDGYAAQQRTDIDYRGVEPARCGSRRRAVYAAGQLAVTLAVRLPVAIGAVMLIAEVAGVSALHGSAATSLADATLYRDALAVSFVFFFGAMVAGLLVAGIVPRVLVAFIAPETTYRLYGVHYWIHQAIGRLTNIPFYPHLFGDSSYIVYYLRWLGYRLTPVVQTGSNFGLEVKHDNPFLCSVGGGTMVADGLSMINTDYSSTSFRQSWVDIGPGNFLGNYIVYPTGGRTGDDCLIGTRSMVPLDGEVRQGTGLLGSPAFEIPRSVQRDRSLDHLAHGEELRRRLAAKNRYNAGTIAMYLLSWWMFSFGVTVLGFAAVALRDSVGPASFALAAVLALAFAVVHFTLVERLSTGFRDLEPRFCSIYEPYFWWHERFWKLAWQPLILDGTPFKSLVWRLLGVRIGRRVFDDGAIIMEKTLTTIGDDCTLNARSIVQPHSQEDGSFKSDRIVIGAGCTLGIGVVVHYGVTMGDGAVLAADSFLMKGEEVPPHAYWGGNPAREQTLSERSR